MRRIDWTGNFLPWTTPDKRFLHQRHHQYCRKALNFFTSPNILGIPEFCPWHSNSIDKCRQLLSSKLEKEPTETESRRRNRKPVVGLAGGVGAGKSTVAQIMADLGAGVISSDQLGHQEINAPDVKSRITEWWGKGVLLNDGTVDRKQIASVVFADPLQRHRLESLLHPRIAVRRADRMAELEAQPRVKFIVMDSPLLYEADLDLECDAVVFVDADASVRKDRSEKLRGWPEGELIRREKSQQPLDMKRARADYICKNNSNQADLRKQVEDVVTQILADFGSI